MVQPSPVNPNNGYSLSDNADKYQIAPPTNDQQQLAYFRLFFNTSWIERRDDAIEYIGNANWRVDETLTVNRDRIAFLLNQYQLDNGEGEVRMCVSETLLPLVELPKERRAASIAVTDSRGGKRRVHPGETSAAVAWMILCGCVVYARDVLRIVPAVSERLLSPPASGGVSVAGNPASSSLAIVPLRQARRQLVSKDLADLIYREFARPIPPKQLVEEPGNFDFKEYFTGVLRVDSEGNPRPNSESLLRE